MKDSTKAGKSLVRCSISRCHPFPSEPFEDSVLSSPKILHVPLLLLANKQDSPGHLSVEEIRENYEQWYQGKKDSARRVYGEASDVKHERFASLDVMGISALEGYFLLFIVVWQQEPNIICQH